eukprot:scaffold651331_cov47-Prasinocladus_malaysianus.AAC.1
MSGITYVNSDSLVYWSIPNKGVWQDLDGSGTNQTAGTYAVARHNTEFLSGVCEEATSAWGGNDTWFCPAGTKIARFAVMDMNPFNAFDQDDMYVTLIENAT